MLFLRSCGVKFTEQIPDLYIQRTSNVSHNLQGDISFTSLDSAYVSPMPSSRFRKTFLRPATLPTEVAHTRPELFLDGCH